MNARAESRRHWDVAVIGAGIVGLAVARELQRRGIARHVVVIEKEPRVAAHQSGHNSGVLHSGIYYKPGSLKARMCREGKQAMEAFCREQEIPYEICGKVIVATEARELPALEVLLRRGKANGVGCEAIDADQLRILEPAAAGIRALHVPEAGIINYGDACRRMADQIAQAGGHVWLGAEVRSVRTTPTQLELGTSAGNLTADRLVNCAGLHSDRIALMAGAAPSARIVPFRGEYYQLAPEKRFLCRNLIYPVPDPALPFLGVHFTRMIDGEVECGPNAVLAFSREGYGWSHVSPRDLAETVLFRGFPRLAKQYWRTGVGEVWRSMSKPAFVRALQRLVPAIRGEDLRRAGAGVRAQAVGPEGRLIDDFVIETSARAIHVLNAPSPAATASLAIASYVVDRHVEAASA